MKEVMFIIVGFCAFIGGYICGRTEWLTREESLRREIHNLKNLINNLRQSGAKERK